MIYSGCQSTKGGQAICELRMDRSGGELQLARRAVMTALSGKSSEQELNWLRGMEMGRVAGCRERRWSKRRPRSGRLRTGGLSDRVWAGSCFVLFPVFAGSIVGCLGKDGRGACSKIGSVPVWRRSRVGIHLGRVAWCHFLPVLCG